MTAPAADGAGVLEREMEDLQRAYLALAFQRGCTEENVKFWHVERARSWRFNKDLASDLLDLLPAGSFIDALDRRGAATTIRAMPVPHGYALALVGPYSESRGEGYTQIAIDQAAEVVARAVALAFDPESHHATGFTTRQDQGEARWPLYVSLARVAVAAMLGVLAPRAGDVPAHVAHLGAHPSAPDRHGDAPRGETDGGGA